ncbi:MAG: lipase family protein [Planctomycetota bacterium]
MTLDNRWEAVLDPGKATDFFASRNGRPAMDPGVSGWDLGHAWWCSEISRTIYRRDGRATFFERVGLGELRFFDEGGTQCAVVVGEGCAVLVFRGTADLRDCLTNLRVAPVEWPYGGRVHEGFARGLAKVWDEVESALDQLRLPTFVTGHSLGGALATLAAARREFVAAYTFGAPRVGDAAFWQTLRCPLHRVVNDRDVVPTLPPKRLDYTHGGLLQHIAGDDTVRDDLSPEDLAAVERSLSDRRWFDPHETLADHAPVNYTAHLAS